MLLSLLYLVLVSLSLGQVARVFEIGGSNLYLFDIFAALFAFYGLFYFLYIKKRYQVNKYLILFFVFSLVALISLFLNFYKYSPDQAVFAFYYFFRWLIYLISANNVFNMFKQGLLEKTKFVKAITYSGVFIALAGFIQLIILPDFSVLDPAYGWDPHKNRLASTFFDPNFTGAFLVMCFSLLIFGKNFKDLSRFEKVSSLLILFAIILTYSRSAWGMFGVVIFVYGLKKSFKIVLIALLACFLAYFLVPRVQTRLAGVTDPADSASLRLVSWKNTLEIANDNLVYGVGFNAFKYAQIEYGFLTVDNRNINSATGSDSSFLLVLATTGILGFSLFTLAYFYPVFFGKNAYIVAVLMGLFLESQFINSLFYPQIMFLWLIFVSNQLLFRT